jgi:hypothetical protein
MVVIVKRQRQLRRMVGKDSQGVTEESLRSHIGVAKESLVTKESQRTH